MNAVLYPLLAGLSWVALGYRLRDLKRSRDPALISVCVCFGFLASTFTVSTPAIWVRFDHLIGIPNLATLWTQGCVIAFATTVQIMLLYWAHSPAQAWAKARWRIVACVVAIAAMVALFSWAAPSEERTTDFVVYYAHDPHYAVYLLVYIGSLAVGATGIARLTWGYARVAGRPWIRRGLRTATMGAVLGLVYCAARIADVIGARLGADLYRWEIVAQLCSSIGALLVLIGLTIPAWGPRLSAAWSWINRYRCYHQLHPLWLALYRATPEIALDPPSSPARDRWTPRDLEFRLYRRIIEISDGRLALRPYLDPEVTSRSQHAGRAAGLSDDELRVAVEAAELRAALLAKENNRVAANAEARETAPGEGGGDLSSELAWLVRVARAFNQSPVVESVVSNVSSGSSTER